MPWTPPVFTPSITWQDSPSSGTPLDAANLNLEENSEASYAAQVGASLASYLEGGASSTVVTQTVVTAGNLGAAYTVDFNVYGTNQLLVIGTLNANCTITFSNRSAGRSVLLLVTQDGTGGRTLSVSDGITPALLTIAGSAGALSTVQVTCPDATNLDVSVLGASGLPSTVVNANVTDALGRTKVQGPTGGALRDLTSVMDAPFNAVGDGVADDTTAVQNAMNAVSTAGGGVVVFPAGRTFKFADVTPKSNVTLWLYGATVKMKAGAAHGLMYWNSGVLSNFQMRGGRFIGTSTETAAQYVFGGENPGSGADIIIQDTYVANWATSPYFIVNTGHILITNNRFLNTGVPSALNTIDIVDRAVGGTYDVIVTNNIIEGSGSCAIAYVNTGNTVDGDRQIIVSNNICSSQPGSNGVIDIECATVGIGKNTTIAIANNTVLANLASSFYAVVINASRNDVRELSITGNVIICVAGNANSRGLYVSASGASITGNRIIQRTPGSLQAVLLDNQQSTTLTGDLNATTSVANVTGSQAHVVNGATVTNANLPTGTWIVSGAGTSTWTLSAAATGTVVGATLIVNAMSDDVVFVGNSLRTATDPSNNAFYFHNLRYAKIANNVFSVDSGSTTSTQSAVRVDNCAWCDVNDNQVNYGPHHGITIFASHGIAVERNSVYNCAESGNNGTGILWTSTFSDPGTGINVVRGNRVIDDRAVHKMQSAVSPNSLVDVIDNYLMGFTSTAIAVTPRSKRGNIYRDPGALTGRVTLTGGTASVATTEIQASDNVLLSVVAPGGTRGEVQLGTISASVSFVVNSIQPGTASTLQGADTSTVYWEIRH